MQATGFSLHKGDMIVLVRFLGLAPESLKAFKATVGVQCEVLMDKMVVRLVKVAVYATYVCFRQSTYSA